MKKYLIIAAILLVVPQISQAAILLMDPATSQLGPNNTASIKLRLDNQGKCINALEVGLKFPNNLLELVDFSTGESFVNLWIEKPSTKELSVINNSGEMHIAGGIPGGYCGKIPGDPGDSNIIGTAIFKLKNNLVNVTELDNNLAEVTFASSSKILLNDGQGTETKLQMQSAVLVMSQKSASSSSEWNKQIEQDKILPEPFEIELNKDANVYGGKYFIIFSSADKQTGIDHYEVQEAKLSVNSSWGKITSSLRKLLRIDKDPVWKRGSMPYLLEDQTLHSIIRVKAIDKAGNSRLVEYSPEQDQIKASMVSLGFIKNNIGKLSLILILVVLMAIVAFKRKKNLSKN